MCTYCLRGMTRCFRFCEESRRKTCSREGLVALIGAVAAYPGLVKGTGERRDVCGTNCEKEYGITISKSCCLEDNTAL